MQVGFEVHKQEPGIGPELLILCRRCSKHRSQPNRLLAREHLRRRAERTCRLLAVTSDRVTAPSQLHPRNMAAPLDRMLSNRTYGTHPRERRL